MDKNVNGYGNWAEGGDSFSAGGGGAMRQTYRAKRLHASQRAAAAVAREVTSAVGGQRAGNPRRAEGRLVKDILGAGGSGGSSAAKSGGGAQPYVEAISVAEAVGKALSVAVEQGGLSRRAIAKALAVSEETLQNWSRLSRSQPIPAWQMLRLAALLVDRGQKVAAGELLSPALAVLDLQPGVTDRAPLSQQGCQIGSAAGGLLGEIVSATAGQSEAGEDVSAAEREKVLARLRALEQEVGELRAVLQRGEGTHG